MTQHHDRWERLPGWVKILVAIGSIWVAGWTSSWAAQEFRGLPAAVADHESRIVVLENAKEDDREKINRNFIYLACRLDEIRDRDAGSGPSNARCNLILDAETQDILRTLRGNSTLQ